jgi:hypothetical protein
MVAGSVAVYLRWCRINKVGFFCFIVCFVRFGRTAGRKYVLRYVLNGEEVEQVLMVKEYGGRKLLTSWTWGSRGESRGEERRSWNKIYPSKVHPQAPTSPN